MLQFVTNDSPRYSVSEQAQMALEGGCRWIELSMPGASDEEVKTAALEIAPMCQEHDAFFLITDRIELVKELRVHGVHLTSSAALTPAQAREYLGPHAVIGIDVTTPDEALAAARADLDYVRVAPSDVAAVGASGAALPVVEMADKAGEIKLSPVVRGVALSETITEASDPVAYIRDIFNMLNPTA